MQRSHAAALRGSGSIKGPTAPSRQRGNAHRRLVVLTMPSTLCEAQNSAGRPSQLKFGCFLQPGWSHLHLPPSHRQETADQDYPGAEVANAHRTTPDSSKVQQRHFRQALEFSPAVGGVDHVCRAVVLAKPLWLTLHAERWPLSAPRLLAPASIHREQQRVKKRVAGRSNEAALRESGPIESVTGRDS